MTAINAPWVPTTARLLDRDKTPRRFDDYRFELVDRRNRRLGDIHPDLGRNPTITMDTTRIVHRSLDGFYLPATELHGVNVLTDRVRVWMTLQNGDEKSLGVFLWADGNEPLRPWGYEKEGKLLDKTHMLDQPNIWPISLGRDNLVLEFAQYLLTFHPEFDPSYEMPADWRIAEFAEQQWVQAVIIYCGEDEAGRVLGTPVAWQGSTHILVILNDLMRLVGYLPVHCDENGTLQMRPAPELTYYTKPELYYSLENNRMIEQSINRASDLLSAPNCVVVTEASGNSSPIIGVWHAPSNATYSAAKRGFINAVTYNVHGLGTKANAERIAKMIGQWLLKAGDWIEWQGPADPRHGAYDVLSVLDEKWIEVSWKLPLRAGDPMSHRARKVYTEEPEQIGWPV